MISVISHFFMIFSSKSKIFRQKWWPLKSGNQFGRIKPTHRRFDKFEWLLIAIGVLGTPATKPSRQVIPSSGQSKGERKGRINNIAARMYPRSLDTCSGSQYLYKTLARDQTAPDQGNLHTYVGPYYLNIGR